MNKIAIPQETIHEILEFIKARTGALAAHVVLGTSEMPCELERKGIGCAGVHPFTKFSYGIHPMYQIGFYQNLLHAQVENQGGTCEISINLHE